jgi:hypothetical protein
MDPDPDPGGPKTYGSGPATLFLTFTCEGTYSRFIFSCDKVFFAPLFSGPFFEMLDALNLGLGWIWIVINCCGFVQGSSPVLKARNNKIMYLRVLFNFLKKL